MEKFNQLISLFTSLGVYFENISPTEIMVPCPCNVILEPEHLTLPMLELCEHPEVPVMTDEIYIRIGYDEKRDSLNWLVLYDDIPLD